MLLISAGHHPTKPGACFNGFCEYEEAKKWVSLITNHLGHDAIAVPNGTLKNKVEFINSRPGDKKDIAIEVHFNSAVDKEGKRVGKGSETLYYPGSKRGEWVAAAVQFELGKVMIPDRGTKEGWYQMNKDKGPDFFLAMTRCTALILEPEFIHRRAKIDGRREIACEIIAGALLNFLDNEE